MKPLLQPLQAILFDLGDTLIYFDENHRAGVLVEAHQALLRSLQESGIDVGEEFIRNFYSRMEEYYRDRDTEFIEYTTYYVLCRTLLDWGYNNIPDSVLRLGLAAFHRITQAHWIPESDTLPTLEKLKEMGYRMALVSNAADDADTQVLVDKAGIRPYMEVILSSASIGVRKPNPKIFEYVLQKMSIAAQHAAMVGDTLGADILGARNAGIFSIWLSRRGDTPANHAHRDTIIPDAEIATLSELPRLLDQLKLTI
jgi:putative hydrolase of the HAD superfamily